MDRARNRIEKLLDTESFVELAALVKNAGVVTGYGTISGRLVYIYSQAGPVNTAHAKKIAGVYQAALKIGVPVIGLLDSEGVKLEDGLNVLEAYGLVLSAQAQAYGVVPQISVVMGDCLGLGGLVASSSDFVYLADKKAKFLLESPGTYKDGKNAENFNFTERTIDFVFENESECFENLQQLMEYLPSNNMEGCLPVPCNDSFNREDESLAGAGVQEILASVADNGRYMDLKKSAPAVTAFARMGGYTVGVLGFEGKFDADSMEKMISFVKFCDSFNIPICSFGGVSGYDNSTGEDGRLLKSSARLLRAFANAAVPKISVITKTSMGSAYLVFNSKHTGADVVYAWAEAAVGLLDAEAARKILGVELSTSAVIAAEENAIDYIVEPAATRKRVLVALEMLSSKRMPAGFSKKTGW